MALRIGFIGTGTMGDPMVRNLLGAGYAVTAYNRSIEKLAAVQEAGADTAATPRQAAEHADCVLLMLTGPEAVDSVLFGPDGVLEAQVEGLTVVNMSTVSPQYTRSLDNRLKERGAALLDAPVSGSRKPAETGELVILAGGPADLVEALRPVFLAMGKKVVHCGETGMGSAMKMTANMLLSVSLAGFSEALCHGRQCGLDTDLILDTLLSGPMNCQLFALKETMFRSGTFTPPQFTIANIVKDMRFILQTADSAGAPALMSSTAFQLYRAALAHGQGDEDFAAVIAAMETMCEKPS